MTQRRTGMFMSQVLDIHFMNFDCFDPLTWHVCGADSACLTAVSVGEVAVQVWPLAALINYKFVPLQFRVLFINFVAMFWSVISY